MSRKLVNLKDGSDYLVPEVFGGIDTTNVLYSLSWGGRDTATYTATEDCYIVFIGQTNGVLTIDGVDVMPATNEKGGVFAVKSGTVVTVSRTQVGYGNTYLCAYGIKY